MKLWYVKTVPHGSCKGSRVLTTSDNVHVDTSKLGEDQDMVADFFVYRESLVDAMETASKEDGFMEWLGVSKDDNTMVYMKDHLDHLQ